MKVKVVAFDVHGTLVHWPKDRVQSFDVQRLLERYGVSISFQAFDAGRQQVFFLDAPRRKIHGYVDFLALQFARMEVKVPLDLIEGVAALYERRDHMMLFDDTLDALGAVKAAGRVSCAFTSIPEFMLGAAADSLRPGLDHYFDAGAVGVAKGDRRFYQRIAAKLGVAPEEILCVGDDPVGDGLVPMDVGWRAVLLDRSGRAVGHPDGPQATIRTLAELRRFYETDS